MKELSPAEKNVDLYLHVCMRLEITRMYKN